MINYKPKSGEIEERIDNQRDRFKYNWETDKF